MKNYLGLLAGIILSVNGLSQPGIVLSEQKISDTEGTFTGVLDDGDRFGEALENIGDLNDDGVDDLAIAAVSDDDGGSSAGAVYILFMNSDGTVASHQKISNGTGGLTATISASDRFGSGIAALGDLDGDGVEDIAVGASGDDTGGSSGGAVYILFMNTDGTVSSEQKIAHGLGGFSGDLSTGAPEFGVSIAPIGDLDGDGKMDIVVGAFGDDDGGSGRGAAYILFLDACSVNADFTVDDMTPCQDHPVNFTNTSVNTGTVSFEWLEDGSSIGTTTDLTHSFGSGGSFLVELVTSKLNCADDTTEAIIDVTPSTYVSFADTACESYTVPSGDETYTVSGTYNDTIPNSVGCDSVMTIDVTINNATTNSFTANACTSYTVPSGDETYTVDGIYNDTIPNAAGCDSIMTITVDIGTFASSSFSVTECESYTVPSGDETHTISGTYMDTIPSVDGCDSIMTIDVTINMPTTNSFAVTECDSYTVPSGDETYTVSGVYNDTIPNMVGCDSVMTIDVTINSITMSSITVDECAEYTVPSGDETHNTSGVYMDTIPNTSGCDSIITIDLTITIVDTSVTATDTSLMSNASGATYQWIDCNTGTPITGETDALFEPTSDGSYAVVVTEGSCTDTSACYDIIGLGTDAITKDWLTVYPNPTEGMVNLKFNSVHDQLTIQVRDISGRLIYNMQLVDKKQHIFNIEGEAGIYFVDVIRSEGVRSTIKVVKR